ncbi:hypothetical protein E5288_WYG018692 [Bos mutus]|uniref:Uncharacterized protein n=1 Tax=Bos mutus TaxID=72004 RepID=A0A6B0R1Q2_9CETA|nr:hypothetical protein [Bos mutus]
MVVAGPPTDERHRRCVRRVRVLALRCRLYLHETKLTRVRSYSFSPGPRLKTRTPDLGPAETKNTRPSWTYSQIQPPELSRETPASADPHSGEKQMLLVLAAVIILQQYLTDTIS